LIKSTPSPKQHHFLKFQIVETHFSELDLVTLDRTFGPKQELDKTETNTYKISHQQSDSQPKKTVAFEVDQVQKLQDSALTIQQKQEKEVDQEVTAEGSINLQKVDTKVKDNDQNSDLTAKLKKKRQLPEVGGSSYLTN
jgi:hypothetical protein